LGSGGASSRGRLITGQPLYRDLGLPGYCLDLVLVLALGLLVDEAGHPIYRGLDLALVLADELLTLDLEFLQHLAGLVPELTELLAGLVPGFIPVHGVTSVSA
jgi:hypothetical protein